jgi:molybdopterin-containing oxidoreductase family iron-sulfur binding subunit
MPYEQAGIPRYQRATVQKCDFCTHRLEKGLQPACIAGCPAKARYFGDLDDPLSEVSRLIRERRGFQLESELGTDPSVYYIE